MNYLEEFPPKLLAIAAIYVSSCLAAENVIDTDVFLKDMGRDAVLRSRLQREIPPHRSGHAGQIR